MSSALFDDARWSVAAVAAGVLPLLAAVPFHTCAHQHVSSLLLFMLMIGAIHAGKFARGVAAIGVAFLAHSLVAIALARLSPASVCTLFPGGPEYWTETHTWLVTGKDPEYELAAWLPAHLQLTGAVVLLGYVSMGLIPLMQGFHEVDLMNFYVGRLLSVSADAPTSLALGWHPWSVARGLGFCLLVFCVAWVSHRRFTGRDVGSWRFLALRGGLGLGLLVADALMKYGLLEVVRVALAAGLVTESA
ncbi:MAG: hypothetical protein QM765_42935 [Myxococcales bacterium]